MGNDNTVSYGTYPQMLGEPITKEVFDKFRGNWEMPSGVVKVCQPEKHFCSYCQSTSHDDMRGNCCCCGAPRGKQPYMEFSSQPPVILGNGSGYMDTWVSWRI